MTDDIQRAAGSDAASASGAPILLPSESELYRRYKDFSIRYFDNATPAPEDVTIQWSTRLTSSAGKCYPKLNIIRLSTHYHAKFVDEVDETLLHEMIHLLVPNHGPRFYAWMEHIRARGGVVNRYSRERATPATYRWEYTCIGCGTKARRQRRLAYGGKRHRCRRCGGMLREAQL